MVRRRVVVHGDPRRAVTAGAVLALVASVCVAGQVVAPAPAAAAATVPAPAGSWPFSEGSGTDTADSSGHGNTGTLGAGVTWAAPNVGAHSIATNGTASGAVTVTGPVVNTAASFTASAWVYLNTIAGGAQTFVSINGLASPTGTTVSGFFLQFQGGAPDNFAFTFRASDATGSAVKQAVSPPNVANVALHTWYHVVGVYNTSTISLYVNGALQQSTAYSTAWQATGNTMIGQGMYGGGTGTDFVNGRTDDVALYNQALTAAQVAALNQPTISAGYSHTCEIISGNAYCWGLNASGQLGNNSTVNSTAPVPVYTGGALAGLTLTQISAGDNSTCALASTGTAYCWGGGGSGQLGNGTTTAAQSTPVPVTVGGTSAIPNGTTLTQITTGHSAACALASTGTAYCWGLGTSGQLGNNQSTSSNVAVAVSGVTTFTQIAAGKLFACGVTSAGAAYCWGDNTYGQLGNNSTTLSPVPVAVTVGSPSAILAGTTLNQVSAGANTACALASTGAAYCWGHGTNGQLGNGLTPATQTTAVAVTQSGVTLTQVSTGNQFTCALSSTGAAYCWGIGTNGDLGNNSTTISSLPVLVSTSGVLAGVTLTQVSPAGGPFACALDTSGTAYCWGDNTNGKAGNPDTAVYSPVPVTVAAPQAITVAAGNIHSCEIVSGTAYCWGDNSNGELGNNTVIGSNVPVTAWTGGVLSGVTLTEITTGTNFTCALSAAGAAYCWGLGTSGQLGDNLTTSSSMPVAVTSPGAGVILTQITAGGATACALASAGAAYCWGAGGSGQLGNGTTTAAHSTPAAVTMSGLTFTQLTVGGAYVCALSGTGAAYCWGDDTSGELGNNVTLPGAQQSTPVPVYTGASGAPLLGVTLTQITAGGSTVCALSNAGAAYCWGLGTSGQLGNSSTTTSNVPVTVTTAATPISGVALSQITEGSNSTCALSTAALAYCWGGGASGQLGNGSTTASQTTAVAVTATGVLSGQLLGQITAGTTFVCALSTVAGAYCWGGNGSGQLGNPATTAAATVFDVPVAVTSETTSVESGYLSGCMLRNGKAYCWGDDTFGELGNNLTSGVFSTPQAVIVGGSSAISSGTTLTQIASSNNFTCALSSAGNAYCWGPGSSGQLGNGTLSQSNVPTAVTMGGNTFTQITTGTNFVCALTVAGNAYCWGTNASGQMGHGACCSQQNTPIAVTMPGGTTFTQITAGNEYACALTTTGGAYCWGLGTTGQLGQGTAASSSTPVAVTMPGNTAFTQIAASHWNSTTGSTCAVSSAGAAYCWGLNSSGQLGDNTTTQRNLPTAVYTACGSPCSALNNKTITQVSVGGAFTCALDSTGAAYCWGLGTGDQLGNNAAASSNFPVAVYTLGVLAGKVLTQIGSGQLATCAEDTTGAIYCWGTGTSGQLGNGTTTSSAVPVSVLPGPPTSVTAFPGDTTATVYWVAPGTLGTDTVTNYTVTVSPGGATYTTANGAVSTHTFTGLSNGTTYTVTVVTNTSQGPSAPSAPATVTPWPPGTIAAGGFKTSCTLYNGKAYCWGDDTFGELGNNIMTGNPSLTPVAVYTGGLLSGVTLTQITVGYFHVCALASTGAVYCWGEDNYGQLGNGTTDSSIPLLVSGGLTFTQISAGKYHTCGVTSVGAAYCWGENNDGQLGDNTTTAGATSAPTLVYTTGTTMAGKTIVQVAAGFQHTCALDTAGLVYCWGLNQNGELGNNNNTTNTDVPGSVYTTGSPMASKVVVQVTAGGQHTCALDNAGLAYCWGYGVNGQLGTGPGIPNAQDTPAAVTVGGASTILPGTALVGISASEFHTCAVDSTGVGYCWGYNADGRLGTNNTTTSNTAVFIYPGGVLSGMTVVQVSAGPTSGCALDSTGTAYCWGSNSGGQVGNDTITQEVAAVLVGPQAPTNVSAAPGDTTAAVSWTAPVYLNNGTLTGYTASSTPGLGTCSTAAGTTTCTITGLTDGTTYTVTVIDTITTGTSAPSSPAVTVEPVGFLTLTSPTSLTWGAAANGSNESVVDAVAGDQQLTVTDNTASGAGWRVTVSATTFTNGTHTLPNAGVLGGAAMDITGSVAAASSQATTAPTATCVGSCTLPTIKTGFSYPVEITTASSPSTFTIYDTSASTGEGVMTMGGSTAANPIGWWVQVPASGYTGTYTSTVTLEVVSGP